MIAWEPRWEWTDLAGWVNGQAIHRLVVPLGGRDRGRGVECLSRLFLVCGLGGNQDCNWPVTLIDKKAGSGVQLEVTTN